MRIRKSRHTVYARYLRTSVTNDTTLQASKHETLTRWCRNEALGQCFVFAGMVSRVGPKSSTYQCLTVKIILYTILAQRIQHTSSRNSMFSRSNDFLWEKIAGRAYMFTRAQHAQLQ